MFIIRELSDLDLYGEREIDLVNIFDLWKLHFKKKLLRVNSLPSEICCLIDYLARETHSYLQVMVHINQFSCTIGKVEII